MVIAGLAVCIAAWLKPQAAGTHARGTSRFDSVGAASPGEAIDGRIEPNDLLLASDAATHAKTRPAGMPDRRRATEKPLGQAQIDEALLKELRPSGGKALYQLTSFAADFDGDGRLDDTDLSAYAEAFDIGDPKADLNSDGIVDGDDFALFADNFDARTELTKVFAATEYRILITPKIADGAPTTGNKPQQYIETGSGLVTLEFSAENLASGELLRRFGSK